MCSKRALHSAWMAVGLAFLIFFFFSCMHGSIEPVALVVFPFLPALVCTSDEIERV